MRATPPANPNTNMDPTTRTHEVQEGAIAVPAFPEVAGSELAAPPAVPLDVGLAEALELAGTETEETVVDESAESTDPVPVGAVEVVLLAPVPGRPSKETSSARSPHRASRAESISFQLVRGLIRTFVERHDVRPAGVSEDKFGFDHDLEAHS